MSAGKHTNVKRSGSGIGSSPRSTGTGAGSSLRSASRRARSGGASSATSARARMADCLRSLACIMLALALVFGYTPFVSFAHVDVALAADDGEGEGGEDAQDAQDAQDAADQAAAEAVDALIKDLPSPSNITVDDRSAIEAAQSAYDALTKTQKGLVTRKAELDEALAALAAAEEEAARAEEEAANQKAANKVEKLIALLPAVDDVTADDVAQAEATQAAYDALTDAQRALVSDADYQKLQDVLAAARAAAEAGPETYYVKTLLLKWDEPDEDGKTHFVGDSEIVENAYRQIKITDYGKTAQLNGWYLSTDGTGEVYQTADSNTTIGSFTPEWKSSDESIATVSPEGLVTPQGKNGSVVITATVSDERVYQGSAPQATVTIVFDGQEGKYVKKVEILDDAGTNIGEKWGGVTVYDKENEFHQLHARVTWHNVVDGSETVEVTGTGETYDASKIDTTITWNVSTSTAFTINEDTGRLRCGQYSGNAYVTCTAVGGLGGESVTDTANVQLDTGVYEYNPSDSLTLKVVWEERPDEVVKEATYTFDELKKKLTSKRVNATVKSDSRFGVISAEGFLFKDVVNLVSVDDGDVLQYRFATADGYDNPVSYNYLFNSGPRYYFPNWDIGSKADGEIVSPILAYKSAFEWGRSEADPNAVLDEGTRFRLVFGCLASGDSNTSYQIYYIQGITIVLKGGPSAGGNGGKEKKSSSNSGNSSSGGSSSSGKGGSGGGSGSGTSGTGAGSTGTGGGNTSGQMSGTTGDGREVGGAGQSVMEGQNAEEQVDAADADAAGTDVGSAKRWRVYQMMNKNNSDVPDWDDENPISPFAAPLALGTFAAGIGATGIGFRRRLK